jgi:cyclopropane-fatty-acyl-phospholipid synthase
MLLPMLAYRFIREGTLEIVHKAGRRTVVGMGSPRFVVRLRDSRLEWTMALNPRLRFCEAYMDGRITLERGELREFLVFLASNMRRVEQEQRPGPLAHWWHHLVRERNPMDRARRNVAHHYDLSRELYELFLDRDLQYSCAYFLDSSVDLDQAQHDKKVHLAAKLLLDRPGLRILDIGSGWGGLALYLARETGADVTGITLSIEQHQLSEQRARSEGLARQCRFLLKDYREQQGSFDRIVSVGMFEHVGKRNYREFFAKIRDLLAEDGVGVLHAIGRFDEPSPTDPFIRKYIFPGGDLPSLSEVMAAVEATGLLVTDLEILRLHYAHTLQHWYQRVQRHRDRIIALYDERFFRMWSLYLGVAEMGFRYQGLMVFQLQLAKRPETVPLTRDYMYDWEQERRWGRHLAAE